MKLRHVATVLAAGAVMASGAGTAVASDNNGNIADPPISCGSAPLSASGHLKPCLTEQVVRQDVVKRGSTNATLIEFLNVATPLDAPVP